MDQEIKVSLEQWKNELEKKKEELQEVNAAAQRRSVFLEIKGKIAQHAAKKSISLTKQQEFAEKFITPVYAELDKHEAGLQQQRAKNNAEISELDALISSINAYFEQNR